MEDQARKHMSVEHRTTKRLQESSPREKAVSMDVLPNPVGGAKSPRPPGVTRERTNTIFRGFRKTASKNGPMIRITASGKVDMEGVALLSEELILTRCLSLRRTDSALNLRTAKQVLEARIMAEENKSDDKEKERTAKASGVVGKRGQAAFGVPLSEVCVERKDGTFEIPLLVSYTFAYLGSFLFSVDLYGHAGVQGWMQDKVQHAQNAWTESTRIDNDPLVAAELVKLYIQSLPESLFCSLADELRECVNVGFDSYVVSSLHSIVSLLPARNRAMLTSLFKHLKLVCSHSAANGMTVERMARAWETPLSLESKVVAVMIAECDRIFGDDGDVGLEYCTVASRTVVKCATLQHLLIKMLDPYYRVSDPAFFDLFLTTHPYFIQATVLLDHLVRMYLRFTKPPLMNWHNRMRFKILKFLRYWFEDFLDPDAVSPEYRANEWEQFLAVSKGLKNISESEGELLEYFARFQFGGNKVVEKLRRFSVHPSMLMIKTLELNPCDFTVSEVANTMCHVDQLLFLSIQPIECLGNSYLDSSKAVNFTNMTSKFNQWSQWVASSVVSTADLNVRLDLINHWISIADSCVELFNFNSAYAILAGLSMTPVQRLKQTWKKVHKRTMTRYGKLNVLFQMEGNYKNMKDALVIALQSDEPVVPYLGLYSKYLLAIETAAPTFTEKGGSVINFQKMRQIFAQTREMLTFQKKRYQFPAHDKLLAELQAPFVTMSDDELYEASLLIEPRGN